MLDRIPQHRSFEEMIAYWAKSASASELPCCDDLDLDELGQACSRACILELSPENQLRFIYAGFSVMTRIPELFPADHSRLFQPRIAARLLQMARMVATDHCGTCFRLGFKDETHPPGHIDGLALPLLCGQGDLVASAYGASCMLVATVPTGTPDFVSRTFAYYGAFDRLEELVIDLERSPAHAACR